MTGPAARVVSGAELPVHGGVQPSVYRHLPRISLPATLAGSSDPQAGLLHPNVIGGALALLIPVDVAL